MRMVWLVVAALSLLFWGFCAFNLGGVLTGWPPLQAQYGVELFTWIQGFPLWREAIWGASIALGLLGSLLMFARMRLAGDVLFGAFVLLAAGFAYDLALEDGMLSHGRTGLLASGILVGLAGLSALAGYASAGKGKSFTKSKQSTASRDAAAGAAASAQALTPASSTAPEPEVFAPPGYAATLPEAPANDQDDLGASPEPVPEAIAAVPDVAAPTASGPGTEPLSGDAGASPAELSEFSSEAELAAPGESSQTPIPTPPISVTAPASEELTPAYTPTLPEAPANDQDDSGASPTPVPDALTAMPQTEKPTGPAEAATSEDTSVIPPEPPQVSSEDSKPRAD